MSAGLVPLAPVVTGAVLLVVLIVGVSAGRAKGRWTLLAAGIVVLAAVGVVLAAIGAPPPTEDPAAELTALYTIAMPLAIAYVAGWLAARGSWLRRFVVIAVGALLLVAFPYAAAGKATADAFLGGG
jgi:hypothetical protein